MKELLDQLVSRFETLESELNALDAATGDGDHGATILKGLRAAAAAPDAPAKAFRQAAGGASGSLFGQIIAALDKVEGGQTALDAGLEEAAGKIMTLGQAKPGDKTMLDALVPAAAAGADATAAAEAAEAGLEATRAMAAKRGRARYVEGAGVGHLDAGAKSVAEILAAYAEWRSQP